MHKLPSRSARRGLRVQTATARRHGFRSVLAAAGVLLLASTTLTAQPAVRRDATIGQLTRWHADFHARVPRQARIEKLADGFTWAEGPTWVANRSLLLFNDVPNNRMFRWTAADGLSVLFSPSGYDGPPDPALREAGANGLHAEPDGRVLLADSGSRTVVRLDLGTRRRTVLADRYQGKRFNSPNDVISRSDGSVFFTDPPYGLKDLDASPVKELAFNGVYRIAPDGTVHLVDDSLSFPNGIALSPDERTLYVANSDPRRPVWIAYALAPDGTIQDRRIFADAGDLVGPGVPGLPDGLAVAADGTLFATGPGGVIVFAPDGTRLGRIETGGPIANCAFGDDGRTLYLTAQHTLARVRVAVHGLGFSPAN
jgi:gluconolactonase